MVNLQQEKGVAKEEVRDLRPAVVENLGPPVAMLAEPGVLVFIKVSAVKEAKPVFVAGEVSGNPVKDHAKTVAMHGVDEVGEVVGGAESRCWGEVADGLIAPTSVKGILVDRHQFHVREVEFTHVDHEIVGDLAIVEEAGWVVRGPFPRAELKFINRDRRVERLPGRALLHPFLVVPGEVLDVPDARRGFRPKLRREPVWVAFLDEIVVEPALDFVLINFPLNQAGDEEFPKARRPSRPHGVAAAVPAIEVSHDADAPRVGSPDRERDTWNAVLFG